MALIKCPECGKEISDMAETCPNCGCPRSLIEKKVREETAERERKEFEKKKKEFGEKFKVGDSVELGELYNRKLQWTIGSIEYKKDSIEIKLLGKQIVFCESIFPKPI